MSKVSDKTREIRSRERGAQIDFESERALSMFGIDREAAKKLIADMARGRKVWGVQAVVEQPSEPEPQAARAGEIGGWPLDPSYYAKNGSMSEENGHHNGNGHIEGVVNGMDIRGMVPGAIPIVKVELPSESEIPQHLNIP